MKFSVGYQMFSDTHYVNKILEYGEKIYEVYFSWGSYANGRNSQHRQMNLREGRDTAIAAALEGYEEPIPGAKGRVEKVLRVMLTAWAASMLRQTAERMISEMKE